MASVTELWLTAFLAHPVDVDQTHLTSFDRKNALSLEEQQPLRCY